MPRIPPLLRLIVVAVTAHAALVAARVTTSLYALSLHASTFEVGTLVALFAVFPMLLAVPIGRAIDRIGIRRPLVAGGMLAGAGCALAAGVGGMGVLYPAAVMVGTGFMAIFICAQHGVGWLSAPESRAVSYSKLSLGFSMSGFSGPMIAGFVIDHGHFRVSYGVCAAFALLSCALATRMPRSGVPPQAAQASRGSPLALLRDRELRRVYAVVILLAAGWDMFTFVTPIRGTQLGLSASVIGAILASFSAATFTVRLAMPKLSARFREWQILAGGLAVASLSYALFPFLSHPLAMGAAAFGLGLALGCGQPNVLALLHRCAPPGRGAEAIGIRATIGNASAVSLPLAFGAAGATLGLFAVFWGLAFALACGVPLAARKAFEHSPSREQQP